ncbi:uncharacterized protein SOCE836_037140 [Sorangium cellulosum]|uniref:Uncharacterized protein n=1 Tax=Sorangium cellulosum TaxID=56 RepID=A0A4P2QQ00_SORCE|nr:uncharacterized protein SOCE836_037140 [Sorangium cellulosum]
MLSDHCGIDPRFGTLDEFDALVRDARGTDLEIILESVLLPGDAPPQRGMYWMPAAAPSDAAAAAPTRSSVVTRSVPSISSVTRSSTPWASSSRALTRSMPPFWWASFRKRASVSASMVLSSCASILRRRSPRRPPPRGAACTLWITARRSRFTASLIGTPSTACATRPPRAPTSA